MNLKYIKNCKKEKSGSKEKFNDFSGQLRPADLLLIL